MAKLKITPIRNFQHVGAEGKEGLRAGVTVELPEVDAKSYVEQGWAVLSKEEGEKESVKLRKEADKLKSAVEKAKAALAKVKPEAKEKAEADFKALEEKAIEADLKATEAEEAEQE